AGAGLRARLGLQRTTAAKGLRLQPCRCVRAAILAETALLSGMRTKVQFRPIDAAIELYGDSASTCGYAVRRPWNSSGCSTLHGGAGSASLPVAFWQSKDSRPGFSFG